MLRFILSGSSLLAGLFAALACAEYLKVDSLTLKFIAFTTPIYVGIVASVFFAFHFRKGT